MYPRGTPKGGMNIGKGDRYIESYKYQNSQLKPWKNRQVNFDELIDSMKGQSKFMRKMLKRKGKKK